MRLETGYQGVQGTDTVAKSRRSCRIGRFTPSQREAQEAPPAIVNGLRDVRESNDLLTGKVCDRARYSDDRHFGRTDA